VRAVLLSAAAALLVAACGSDDDDSAATTADATSDSVESSATAPATVADVEPVSEFIMPLYFLSSSDKWPMTLAVYNFFGIYESSWNLVSADVVLTILPVLVVFLLGQRHITSGITTGAVKG
jgi:hypothetical protein